MTPTCDVARLDEGDWCRTHHEWLGEACHNLILSLTAEAEPLRAALSGLMRTTSFLLSVIECGERLNDDDWETIKQRWNAARAALATPAQAAPSAEALFTGWDPGDPRGDWTAPAPAAPAEPVAG